MKKFEFHRDALIVVIMIFALAAAFIGYQRHQYSILMQENLDLLWEKSNLEANLILKTRQFEECQSLVTSTATVVDQSK